MKKSEMTWYGPHECKNCPGVMIVKAGNGAPEKEQYLFINDSQYPAHKWVKHICQIKK